jgi:hypothetical protein
MEAADVHPGVISNLTTRAVEIGSCGLQECSPGVEAAGFCREWRRDMATRTTGHQKVRPWLATFETGKPLQR